MICGIVKAKSNDRLQRNTRTKARTQAPNYVSLMSILILMSIFTIPLQNRKLYMSKAEKKAEIFLPAAYQLN